MQDDTMIGALVIILVMGLIGFAVEENFRENRYYIAQGYHKVPSTNETWVKN